MNHINVVKRGLSQRESGNYRDGSRDDNSGGNYDGRGDNDYHPHYSDDDDNGK